MQALVLLSANRLAASVLSGLDVHPWARVSSRLLNSYPPRDTLELRAVNPLAIAIPAAVCSSAAVLSYGAVSPSSSLFGPVLNRLPGGTSRPALALTFDDGPNPEVTPRLLDLFEEYSVRATFFLIGRFVRQCPELVREIAARGHAIGNHTDSHPNLFWMRGESIACELQSCRGSVLDALEASATPLSNAELMTAMRPPYGFRNPLLFPAAREAKMRVVTWSRICFDWKPQPPAKLIDRLGRAAAGEIIVMHDGDHRFLNGDRSHVPAALEHWLPRWRDAGFEFVTIPPEA